MFFPSEHSDRDVYRQCGLQRSNWRQVSWIPEKYAIEGKVLKLRENGVWVDGWVVACVGASRVGAPHVPGLIRNHERATGDSRPKAKK